MKLHADRNTRGNAVTAYGDGWVEVNAQRFDSSIVVAAEGEIQRWPVSGFDELTSEAFAALLDGAPELVLLGTGARQRFPHPRLTAPLMQARVGIEVMDTPAACRTFNILASEGRRVVAALLIA